MKTPRQAKWRLPSHCPVVAEIYDRDGKLLAEAVTEAGSKCLARGGGRQQSPLGVKMAATAFSMLDRNWGSGWAEAVAEVTTV